MGKFRKEEIRKAFEDFQNPETRKMIQDLIDRTVKNEKMTQAEIQRACSLMEYSKPLDHDFEFDIYKYDACKDYIFRKLYLVYHGNLDGRLPAHNAFGLVPLEQKKFEIKRLDEFYAEWTPVISKFNHKEALLNDLASEANIELKQLDKLGDKLNWDYRELAQKRKAVTLHSKYIYLTAKEFFEENKSDFVIAKFGASEIEINTHSLIHIMFRHYGGAVKQFDTEKSFHLDTTIKYKELPYELKSIIESLGSDSELSTQGIKFIPVKINAKIYSIWTEKVTKYPKGKGKVEYIRLETFYPTELKEELDKIANNYKEIKIDERLSGFLKIK